MTRKDDSEFKSRNIPLSGGCNWCKGSNILMTRFHKRGTYKLGLSTRFGEKHCNNTTNAIKHLEGTIMPYGNQEGQSLGNLVDRSSIF